MADQLNTSKIDQYVMVGPQPSGSLNTSKIDQYVMVGPQSFFQRRRTMVRVNMFRPAPSS